MAKTFLVVAGNMGVGKTELVTRLSHKFGWRPFYEPEKENPFLADFYGNMRRWAFPSQAFYLIRRFELHRQIANFPGEAIQDRCIYEDAEIFAFNLRKVMEEREYWLYQTLYEALVSELPVPDLVLYLSGSVETLAQRIKGRGREFESEIRHEYLEQLNQLYEKWTENFTRCPMLIVATDDLNFVNNQDHLDFITEKVTDSLRKLPKQQAAGG